MLLDCGNGVFSKLRKQVDFTQLDAVVISHLHPDHYFDLFCLRHAWAGRGQNGPRLAPLPLYLPQEPAEAYNKLATFSDVFDLCPIEMLPMQPVKVKDLELTFHRGEHPLPGYAVMVRGSRCFAYSGDTAWQESLVEWVRGVDFFLCEASALEQDSWLAEAAGHLTARQAGAVGRQAGVKKLILTHFWPEYAPETVRLEASAGYGQEVELAREGYTYYI